MKKLNFFRISDFLIIFILFSFLNDSDLFANLNPAKDRNGFVEISNGETKVIVDILFGGRVVEYSLNGNNVLYLAKNNTYIRDKNAKPDAGRCDFGPEKIVPPRPESWLGEWELIEKTDTYIKIKSKVVKAAGVQLIREFSLNKKSSHLKFTQTIVNISKEDKRYSHWSRTFGELNGICLVPLNSNSRFPKGYMVYSGNNMMNYQPEEGDNEYVKDGVLIISGPPKNPKFVTDDNHGWLAYITQDDQLFVKKFEVFEDKIYGEMTGATVSIWYNEQGICEIEPIGPWEWIEPEGEISFTENWYLLKHDYPPDKKIDLKKIKEIINGL